MMTDWYIQEDFERESRMIQFGLNPNTDFDNQGEVQNKNTENE